MTGVPDPELQAEGGKAERSIVAPAIEIGVVAVAIGMATITFLIINQANVEGKLVSPLTGAALLLGNLLPFAALIVLAGRRIAKFRVARSEMGGGGRLHIRLVALFSLIASVPIVLTVIAASVMFQSGTQFWLSDRARTAFNASIKLAEEGRNLVAQRWAGEAAAITEDLAAKYPEIPRESQEFQEFLELQLYLRNLSEAAVFTHREGEPVKVLYTVLPPDTDVLAKRIGDGLNPNVFPYVDRDTETIWVVINIRQIPDTYLYVGTRANVEFMNKQVVSADAINREYDSLQQRAQSLHLKFNIALFVVALLIIGLAMLIALAVADRLVRPIDKLVGAARQVAQGDLSVRVEDPNSRDEVGTLGLAFNIMTERLQEQTGELVDANRQLESRRALIEAVMSGVTAGVISIDAERRAQLINESARLLLHLQEADAVGRRLAEIAPELDALLDNGEREAIVQMTTGGEPRTLAVKVTRDESGQVLTFDDITQQLLDQRRAAWSDVARRIAHEIKNPLTPIQLAAERLQRRYGRKMEEADGTFTRLTDTIVRQVGDLRRMVDEFSSFARMPKPVFREESLLDIARQAVFLHEVAHPAIGFRITADDDLPPFVCDRRQIGQALTNVVKNAVEAVEAREETGVPGEISVYVSRNGEGALCVEVADNGVGLPIERDRIVEPYMTTRSRGTGLGLAIVKKIVEEHFGTVSFSDRPGGGTLVRMVFDTTLLSHLAAEAGDESGEGEDSRLAALTRNESGRS
ncbi:sensor histidine kinase NtrY-like [Stakelama tenebrarum]|uniref:histidine kinase n=1 Tax=Stakelama tenebrarum TaxID=2711215 RepID=A0A6G6Y627_9SPHN|nr:ATP-binding protein [Sphingosinithalassobacter tenebrarum]QIG80301.1 HAMP domain-containing protein [Sphingosinithalassobacter tenebrarum]